MASIYDYFNKQDISGGGGFKYDKGDSTSGPYLTRNTNRPAGQSYYGSMPNYAGYGYGSNRGTGRSSVDAASGFGNPNPSGMGITSINMTPAIDNRSAALRSLNPQLSDEEQMNQSGSVPAVFKDAGQMGTDLVINPAKNVASGAANMFNFPGMAGGIMKLAGGVGESIANNQMHHKYLDSVFPNRESKQFALFSEGAKGPELGQAAKYFKMAGMTQRDIDNYLDPNSKRFMNTNFFRSMSEDKEAFDTGMSFINNAKATANVYKNMVNASAQDAMDRGTSGVSYDEPDMLNEILPGEPGVDLRPYEGMQSGIDYDAMGLGADPENDLLYGEPGFGDVTSNIPEEEQSIFPGDGLYPDEKFAAPGSIANDPAYAQVMDIMPNEQEYIDINPSFYNVTGRQSGSPLSGLFGNNLTSQLVYGNLDSNAPGVTMFPDANAAAQFITDELNEGNPNSIRSRNFYNRLIPNTIY